MAREPFECQRCNQCCTGDGGIYLTPEQVGPAAACLGLAEGRFIELYLRFEGQRYQVLVDDQGLCRLLGPQGCTIHEAKPDICRRWPFFPALLNDPGAFEEAKLACPGLDPDATIEDFRQFARRRQGEI